jgi:hypothetical protein
MGRWLVQTSIGIKSHQMDVEAPARGKDGSEDCTRERGGCSTRDNPKGLDLGGSFPSHHDVGLGRPMTSPMWPMTSPNVLDTLEAVVCQVAHVIWSRGPRRPNIFLLEANVALKRPNVTLKGHDITLFCLI